MTVEQAISIVRAVAPTLITWGAVVGLAFIFRQPLTQALEGLGKALTTLGRRRIELPGGISLDAEAPPAQTPAPETANAIAHSPDAAGIENDPLLNEAVQLLTARANQVPENQRVAYVIREAAQTGIAAILYQIYIAIFGSQLVLLKIANQAGFAGIEEHFARSLYDRARANDSAFYATYSFEQWIGYMTTSLLLRHEGPRYLITVRGTAFLHFITRARLSDLGTLNNAAH
ncbi:MAG TPA: hypothetical protein VFX20_15545 [Steroidobacteraceae bacterium]|nr:hypothetical protein [Steroidobacteraceae bacterium]